MNRLIIIGNGFDLAHGLKTKYGDFITGYYQNITEANFEDSLLKIEAEHFYERHSKFQVGNLKELLRTLSIDPFFNDSGQYRNLGRFYIEFKSLFFHHLCNLHFRNWVDIEMEYYNWLKKSVGTSTIDALNSSIENITLSFEQYLIKNELPKVEGMANKAMSDIFSNTEINSNEFPKDHNSLVQPYFNKSLILNFNYTPLPTKYKCEDVIYIHGSLGNKSNNRVLLGFGNEKDEFYEKLENLNDNSVLKYIKSMHYSNNPNYKGLFDFIEDDTFQVLILGHSCGLSDKTLLHSIFQNDNCKSIKPYYYQYENETHIKNNFAEMVMNISRHFDNKSAMRRKIVNFEYCSPLPQNDSI